MNRRTTIKSLIGLAAVGVASVSIYEWKVYNHQIDFNLLHQKKKLIAELAEVIIPRTDTPGAKDVKAEDYILRVLEFCTAYREQNFFLNGLLDVESYASDKYNREFVNCTKDQKISIVKHFEDKSDYHIAILNKINNKIIGEPFFVKLKNLTVEGYCMSEIGATKGLAYDLVPVKFESCIPLKANQRSWATK
jgi:hypothetical protein